MPHRMAALEFIDILNVGIVFLDEHGSSIYLNGKAKEMIAKRKDLALSQGGVLMMDSDDASRLHSLMTQLKHSEFDHGKHKAGALRLCKSRPINSMLIMLNSSDMKELKAKVAAVMLLCPDAHEHHHCEEVLRSAFNLTSAECRLVGDLLEGLSLKESAERHKVSLHTVRTQLKHILSKTDARSQAELIKKVLHLPAFMIQPPSVASLTHQNGRRHAV